MFGEQCSGPTLQETLPSFRGEDGVLRFLFVMCIQALGTALQEPWIKLSVSYRGRTPDRGRGGIMEP